MNGTGYKPGQEIAIDFLHAEHQRGLDRADLDPRFRPAPHRSGQSREELAHLLLRSLRDELQRGIPVEPGLVCRVRCMDGTDARAPASCPDLETSS